MPELFRVRLQVGGLARAIEFYSELLGAAARTFGPSLAYIDCGAVILALVDTTVGGVEPVPTPEDIYFSVTDLDVVHARAVALGCLSSETVHDEPAGAISVRPWGERSFYAKDPWGNGLCFADASTLFTGR
jgi:predicted enzyme related to lactoylglutathione lyase